MSGLEDFAPVPRPVRVRGREFAILPLVMRQIPAFAKAIEAPFGYIMMEEILIAVVQFPDEMRAAVSIATGAEPGFLDELHPDEFLALATAVFEVNLDFFARRVLPAAEKMRLTLREISQASSVSSPPVATH